MQLTARDSKTRPSDLLGGLLHRFTTLIFTTSALALSISAVVAGEFPSKTSVPNIVLILIDDLGWADLGVYGNRFHETPNIDRMAREGMRFTDAYAACPVCSPTRASIVSGQYPAHVGVIDFIPGHWRPFEKLRVPSNRTQFLPLDVVTFAEALKPAGYTCGMIGKWHLGGRDYLPDKQGFDKALVCGGGRHFGNGFTPRLEVDKKEYLSDVLTAEAEKFLAENRDRPFCLYLSHYAVHIPLQAVAQKIRKYEQKPKPAGGVNHPVYAAMVEHVDESVGRVLAKLDDLGLAENTVVFFFSDNGGLIQRFDGKGDVVTSNAPLRSEKGTVYEGGIREPFIVRWPGVVKPGSTCGVPVSSVDFYPTFLDIAGAKRPKGAVLDGESIIPLLKQTGTVARDAIYWHYPVYHHSTPAGAIRSGDWKLIEFFDDGRLELYNLREDIGETNNLAAAQPERAKQLREKLAQWRKSVDAAMPVANPDYEPARAQEWGVHPDRRRR